MQVRRPRTGSNRCATTQKAPACLLDRSRIDRVVGLLNGVELPDESDHGDIDQLLLVLEPEAFGSETPRASSTGGGSRN